MLDSVELGETAHKKAGTTVPESIHSFSKFGLLEGALGSSVLLLLVLRARNVDSKLPLMG